MPAAPAPFESPATPPAVYAYSWSQLNTTQIAVNLAYTDTQFGAVITNNAGISVAAMADTIGGNEGNTSIIATLGSSQIIIEWPDAFVSPGSWQLTVFGGGTFDRTSSGLLGTAGGPLA